MRVIETSMGEDLSLFSAYLWQERIRHRVFEERGRQVLEVLDQAAVPRVEAAYADWVAGRLTLAAAPRRARGSSLLRWCARFPAVVGVVTVALVLYPFTQPLSDGQLTTVASWLTITDLRAPMAAAPGVLEVLAAGEAWRWLLPVFIHFGPVHVLFNVTVMIYLGRRVEARYGPGSLLALVGLLGLASNLGQYAANPNPLFGGLSGVGYGLLGFILVLQRTQPGVAQWQVPAAFSGSLLFFLVVFSTGVTERIFDGVGIANTAHWVGLLVGGAIAWVVQARESTADRS